MIVDIVAALALAIWLYLVFARGGFWLTSERDDWQSAPPARVACRRGRHPGARRGRGHRRMHRVAAAPGLSGRLHRHPGRRRQQRRHRRRRPRRRSGGTARRSAARRSSPGAPLPAGWTGKLWAVQPGHRAAPARAGAAATTCCSPMPISSMRRSVLARLVARAEPKASCSPRSWPSCAATSLAERAPDPGLHLLLPDALSVRLGQPHARATAAAAGGCMLVRADALRARRRHRRHPRRADRRLRAGRPAQGARPDLARPDRARAQHPALSGARRHPPHGRALGLCAAALFAAAARRHAPPAWR